MAAGSRSGRLDESSRDRAGGVRDGREGPRPPNVVAGSLVGPEQHPPLDGLGPDLPERCGGGLRLRRPESEEDRTGRVGGDEEPTGSGVDAEEELRVPCNGPYDGGPFDLPLGSPSGGVSIRDRFPRGMGPRPGERGRRPDQAHPGGDGADDRVSVS
jgi:hypothetical protein